MSRLYIRLIFLGFVFPLLAFADMESWPISEIETEEEALFLQRIADFWQEQEFGIAQSQIDEFLKRFPQSAFSDPLRVCIGDLFLQQNKCSDALLAYSSVTSLAYAKKVFLNRVKCLYHLKSYQELESECAAYLADVADPEIVNQIKYYLAASLYQQCLDASEKPDLAQQLAVKAEPYFEELLQKERSLDASQALAYLCCISKKYEKAAQIYLDLALLYPELSEDMLFQAAVIQSQYDPTLALQLFKEIISLEGDRAKEAAYYQLVLSFEAGKHEELAESKEFLLQSIPEERRVEARLYVARSLLSMQKDEQAVAELSQLLSDSSALPPNTIHLILVHLLEASWRANDLDVLNEAISKLEMLDPEDPQIFKGKFSRARMLKQFGLTQDPAASADTIALARQEFSALAEHGGADLAQVLFEWADLEYQIHDWDACRGQLIVFLDRFSQSELKAAAWRRLAEASKQLAYEHPENRLFQEQFVQDLSKILEQPDLFSLPEKKQVQFFLAKALFDIQSFEEAERLLKSLLGEQTPFSQEANAYMLLSLCFAQKPDEREAFCAYAETAITKGADLLDYRSVYLSLFNAYLERSQQSPECESKSIESLYQAFVSGASIEPRNLLWLSEKYLAGLEFEQNLSWGERALNILTCCLKQNQTLEEHCSETAQYLLGKLYSLLGQLENQIAILENLLSFYQTSSVADWHFYDEANLLLAKGYLAHAEQEKAMKLLDELCMQDFAIRSKIHAEALLIRACMQAEKIHERAQDDLQVGQVAAQLKTLVLQKKLNYEPVHLEAALEYVRLVEGCSAAPLAKRLALLGKIKDDFESTEDLLAKDYQNARKHLPGQNKIYEQYMRFIEAEQLFAQALLSTDAAEQNALQIKAKDILLNLVGEGVHPLLAARASIRLQNLTEELVDDGSLFKE